MNARERIVSEIIAALPSDKAPETTEGRQGYLHPYNLSESDVTNASVQLLLRDFTSEGIAENILLLEKILEEARRKHPDAMITLDTHEQYKNMRSYIEDIDYRTVTFAFSAAKEMGITLEEELIRGGTDGSKLSERGLPTPNIFNGGYDYHSRFEWNTIENLEHSLAYTKVLVQYWGEHGREENNGAKR